MANSERQPLLPSDHATLHHLTFAGAARRQTKRFLTSKAGHYGVLALVTLDIGSIFAELILQIMMCEGRVAAKEGADALEALSILGLVFSCLFMVELLANVWSSGWRFFHSWFHCLDAAVIVAALIVDILLRGFPLLEEVGSMVVVLRLWRVFKIIEELSAGADEQMEPLRDRIESMEKENAILRRENQELKEGQAA